MGQAADAKKDLDILAEIKVCDEMITNLKQSKWEAQAENIEDEVKNCVDHIDRYKQRLESLEAGMFGNQNEIV